jgi:hypothetical protein
MGNCQFCGEEAKYKFKNGNLCCSKHTNQCPERKRIISLQHKGKQYQITKKTLLENI